MGVALHTSWCRNPLFLQSTLCITGQGVPVDLQFSSVQFSSVVSDSLRPHESQHARLPCPSALPTKLLLPVPQLFYLCMTACCLFRNYLSVYDCLLPVPQLFISV